MTTSFIDIHCHILPGIDDGARNWDESLAMARMAVEDGTSTVIATPHQLGSFGQNHGEAIQQLVVELNSRLQDAGVPLAVLPGGEIRIEAELVDRLVTGDILSLGDHRRHVLLELPFDVYLPLEPVLESLATRQIVVVLAHPERNQGLIREPHLLGELVDAGCLMQLTAGSLCGTHGPEAQRFAEWMISEGLAHLVASDGHSPRTRRPLIRRAFERLCEIADLETAEDLCCRYPARVAAARTVLAGRRKVARRRRGGWWGRRASA